MPVEPSRRFREVSVALPEDALANLPEHALGRHGMIRRRRQSPLFRRQRRSRFGDLVHIYKFNHRTLALVKTVVPTISVFAPIPERTSNGLEYMKCQFHPFE